MANLITARELYRLLVFDCGIKSLKGQINFQLGDISVAVKRKDVVGDVIQSWVGEWLKRSRIDFLANPSVSRPPDIYLNPKDLRRDWLEIKSFNRADSPRFSIAVFDFFMKDLIERPWHLDADYLIFGYEIDESGELGIRDIWLKKIWQITKAMSEWPLTVQTRGGEIKEIRPCSWYAHRARTKVFESLEDFLSAFTEAVRKNPPTKRTAARWQKNFVRAYLRHYGKEIIIPSWEDIKMKYCKLRK
ncbi:MAG: NgoBV family restriction endonuclease [Synergistaceae bacterium]|nr:NgoBV family restriction endonuclease [Synergistaceae bacterium]